MKSFGIFSVMGSCRRFDVGGCGMITLDLYWGDFENLALRISQKIVEGPTRLLVLPARRRHRRSLDVF